MASVKRLNWRYYDKQGNPIDRQVVEEELKLQGAVTV